MSKKPQVISRAAGVTGMVVPCAITVQFRHVPFYAAGYNIRCLSRVSTSNILDAYANSWGIFSALEA